MQTGDIDGHTAVGGLVGFTKDSGSVKRVCNRTGNRNFKSRRTLWALIMITRIVSYSITVKGYAIGQVTGTSEVGGTCGLLIETA